MFGRTAEKQFQPPQSKQMDERTKWLNDAAMRWVGMGCRLVWYGNPATGQYGGFDVVLDGFGIIAAVRANR